MSRSFSRVPRAWVVVVIMSMLVACGGPTDEPGIDHARGGQQPPHVPRSAMGAPAASPRAATPLAPRLAVPTAVRQTGVALRHPALQSHHPDGDINGALRVTSTADPPIITQQEAQQIAVDTGYTYALNRTSDTQHLTLEGLYGLATIGIAADTSGLSAYLPDGGAHPLPTACSGWVGPCPMPIVICKAGQCTDTGKRLGPIKDRPVWVLDYGGFHWERQGCPACPKQLFTHAVIVVDAQEKFVVLGYGYTSP